MREPTSLMHVWLPSLPLIAVLLTLGKVVSKLLGLRLDPVFPVLVTWCVGVVGKQVELLRAAGNSRTFDALPLPY